jgi:subtilase family protein
VPVVVFAASAGAEKTTIGAGWPSSIGTSFSAPLVAGAAAPLRARNPAARPAVQKHLQERRIRRIENRPSASASLGPTVLRFVHW